MILSLSQKMKVFAKEYCKWFSNGYKSPYYFKFNIDSQAERTVRMFKYMPQVLIPGPFELLPNPFVDSALSNCYIIDQNICIDLPISTESVA